MPGWVRAWRRLVEGADTPPGDGGVLPPSDDAGPAFGDGFGPAEHLALPHEHVLPVEDLVRLAASRSRTVVMDGPARDALLAEVEELVRTHPDLAGRDRVAVPYVVGCFRATRR